MTFYKSETKNRLTLEIVFGIALGLLGGFLFKDFAHYLEPIGRAFITLLKMPVLIFMICCIITGISEMTIRDIKKILISTTIFLIGSLIFTQIAVLIIAQAFPPIRSIHHFASLSTHKFDLGFAHTFIPENPFKSFADGTIPAIVVFSIIFALALLKVKRRDALLSNLLVIENASMVIVEFVAKFSFFGVFALAFSKAPSISIMLVPELIYYYFALIFGAVLVSLVMLPLLVTVFLPISFKNLMKPLVPALLLSLMSGDIIVSLPLLLSGLYANMKACDFQNPKVGGLLKALVPLAVTFPISGKILNIIFIYFISWHYQDAMVSHEVLELSLAGIVSAFGSSEGAISFLLKRLNLPMDAMVLFESSKVVTAQWIAFARVASIAALCFFTLTSFEGRLVFKVKTLFLGLVTVMCGFSGWFLIMKLADPIDAIAQPFMQLKIENPVKHKIIAKTDSFKRNYDQSLIESIRRSKTLRVGFNINAEPFAYFNSAKDLVGHDIELAHLLAKDLGVSIIFVPFSYESMADDLNQHKIDIAMSAVSITSDYLLKLSLSKSYMKGDLVLVAKDSRLDMLKDSWPLADTISVGALVHTTYFERAQKIFNTRTIIPIKSYQDFASNKDNEVIFWSSLLATHRVLENPYYGMESIAQYAGFDELAYAMPHDALDLKEYVDLWLLLQKNNGELDRLYEKWIRQSR